MSNLEGTEHIEDVEDQETVTGDTSVDQESPDKGGSDVVESTQVIEVVDPPDVAASNMSYNIATLFVLSMIVGLIVFHILSRRWQT